MNKWLYKWLPIIFGCHCKEERSFHYRGQRFPICARCTGELVGMVVSLFSCFFFRTSVLTAILIMIPMVLDGLIQMFTSYESNNRRRFITGVLFGYGLVMLVAIPTVVAFEYGVSLGQKMRR